MLIANSSTSRKIGKENTGVCESSTSSAEIVRDTYSAEIVGDTTSTEIIGEMVCSPC